ncbi:MAG: MarR family winged helix-turn-helix transcriptional regulator [Hyphomicrobiales bacterium]|nr:MarR family winged helix-turn-helix transcriptional regulator [Hyphomicrobiales bacterium]
MSIPVPYETTLEVRDACLCLHAQRAARALARRFDEVLRPVGLTNGQFSLLMALNRPEPPPPGPVAALLAMDRTTLAAALRPLERRGLVENRVDPADRRARRLVLTEAGRGLLSEAVPIWRTAHRRLEEETPGLDADLARTMLRALAAPLAAGPDRKAAAAAAPSAP